MGYYDGPYFGDDEDENRPAYRTRIAGIVYIMVTALGGAIAIIYGSSILAIFFTDFLPFTTNLPAQPQAIINSIPTTAFIGFYILIGALVVSVISGILRYIFNVY